VLGKIKNGRSLPGSNDASASSEVVVWKVPASRVCTTVVKVVLQVAIAQ